ncbi:hypothetical protein PR202_ga18252 [Eleusine coracana subsp. coracana]|uniref:DUF7054 domain-containing protein n=1 Tax=Eleusine coracana subsp. coracana TaxID=191504 RepID=A0AAV5CSP1_ELECO|nr:hypothetical protein PR202_ga18252 [Eleusine coracana subsp. coracana]
MPTGSAQALALSSPPPEHPHCLLGLMTGRRLTRLLVNVTVDRSLWPVHVVLGAEATVADLVRAAVDAYQREGRRPPLPHDAFDLHFSKYSLESTDFKLPPPPPPPFSTLIDSGLKPEEKVVDLGSRNFFLCPRRPAAAACFF